MLIGVLATALVPAARADDLPLGAEAPPAPADLTRPASGPPPPRAAGPAGPALPGLTPRPDGGWRLAFAPASADLPPAMPAALADLGRRLAQGPQGRVRVVAQAAGPVQDVSAARRLSLARGIAVKAALAAGGLAATRIDIRPAGRTEEALDAADVLPPGVPDPPR